MSTMADIRKVKDHPSLVKDNETSSIMATDSAELAAYKRKKRQAQEVQNLQERQDRIETELLEIKNLLRNALTCVGKDNDR